MAGGPQAPAPPQQQRAPQDRRKAPPPAVADGDTGGDAPKRGNRNAMLPAIIVAVALLGAAFLLKGGGGGETAAVATTPTTVAEAHAAGDPHHMVSLSPITLNLADGSLAKVGIALELADELLIEEIGEDPGNYGARALDEVIEVFGDHTAQQLAASGGKAKIKKLLSERVAEAYGGDVVAVYFTELVVP